MKEQRLVTEKYLSAPKKWIHLLAADARIIPRAAGLGDGAKQQLRRGDPRELERKWWAQAQPKASVPWTTHEA